MMPRPSVQQSMNPLLGGLQSALNAALRHDPETLAALAELQGRVIAIEVKPPGFRLFVLPHGNGLKLTLTEPEAVNVTVSGHAGALLGMLAPGSGSPASQGHVEVRGDIHLAQHMQAVLRRVDIDWEEWLARYIGDTPARKLGRLGRDLQRYLLATGRGLAMDVSDYLRYEKRLLPVHDEIETFVHDVNRLRDDVERARQRLQRLERRQGIES